MGRLEDDDATPDAREQVRQGLRSQLRERGADQGVVDRLMADRQADLDLEGTGWRPPAQS